MREFCKILTAVLVILSTGGSLQAQTDTVFWFAAPEISSGAGDNPIFLRLLTHDQAAIVTISQPANGGFSPIVLSIPAMSVDSVNLTPFLSSIESPAANLVSNNGLKIVATAAISAMYELRHADNRELFSLKGNKALGTNFYTPFQKFWANATTTPGSFSSIEIVAVENNTTVLITPRTAITGHAQNVTFSVVLNAGQTYSARDMNVSAATSLAGSIVSSDKPVALTLFSGALQNGGCNNAVGDQITSVDFAGRNFVVQKGTASTDRVYIMATENSTNVAVTNSGTASTLLNWGETYEYVLNEDINYVTASKPVYVWHVSGFGCDLSAAQVPNLFCAGTYETTFTRTSSDSLGIVLYTRSGFEDQFELNGNAALIPAASFSVVPGTSGEFVAARIFFNTADVPVNSHNVVTNAGDVFGLGVMHGTGGNGAQFGYFSEFNSYPFVDAGIDDTICANTVLALDGQVGGGTITGNWSGTGYGSFEFTSNTLMNNYIPSPLDTLISPIYLILTTTGPCPALKDTLILEVEAAPIVSASADQSLCVNNAVVQLNGSVTGGASTGMWSSSGTGVFTPDNATLNASYEPSATDLSNGNVTLVLTSTNFGTCLAVSDTMEVTFTIAPAVDAGQDTLNVCSNNNLVSLSGAVSGATSSGSWSSTGNGVFSPDNLTLNATYQPSPGDLSTGFVWLYLESTSNGSCNSVKDSVLIQFTPSPVVDAGSNILACTNDAEIALSGTVTGGSSTGTWSGGAGSFNPSSNDLNATYTPTASEIAGGSIVLTLSSTLNGGCNAVSDVVQMNFVAPPFANFNGTNGCLYDATQFSDFSLPGYGNIVSWSWDLGDLTQETQQDFEHQYSNSGNYNVTLIVTSSVGCSDTIVKPVAVYEIPVADFAYTIGCPNNQIIVNFVDQSTTANDPINFWYYDFGGQGASATEDPTQMFAPNGNYTITHIVSSNQGCSDTIVETLQVPPMPVASFSYNSNNGLNVGAVFNFLNTSTNSEAYQWNFGNGATSTVTDPSNTYFSNGTYLVTLHAYSDLGCVDSTSEYIVINTVTDEIYELIPNAISPNGDNKNDVWKLEFLDLLYPDATVSIFNEWGQVLYESVGYTEPWNGTFEGTPVPDGTYFYVIDLKDESLEDPIYKGTILVLSSKK